MFQVIFLQIKKLYFYKTNDDLGLDHGGNKSQNERFVQIRYRPYGILKTTKKIVKIPERNSLGLCTIPQNGLEPSIHKQQFQEGSQTSLQQRRVYGTGFNQRIRIKKDLMASDNQVNNSQVSQSTKTSDL